MWFQKVSKTAKMIDFVNGREKRKYIYCFGMKVNQSNLFIGSLTYQNAILQYCLSLTYLALKCRKNFFSFVKRCMLVCSSKTVGLSITNLLGPSLSHFKA